MAANFFLSSHGNDHLHPRSALMAARQEDLKYATEQELGFVEIWSGTFIQKLCRRLGVRQVVAATAIVYFRRFYLRNYYCDTDPAIVAAACCYVATKAEETPVHIKTAVAEAREVCTDMGYRNFPSDVSRLAEMEFYLIEELDFSLIVFHPYRALVQLTGRDGGPQAGGEKGREKRENMLEMEDATLQMAWFVINDTFRSSLCLVHPPHLIALAAIYLGLALNPPGSGQKSGVTSGTSTPTTTSSSQSKPPASLQPTQGGKTEAITFLASLNVDHALILEIVQEVLSLYELWNSLEVSTAASVGVKKPPLAGKATAGSVDERVVELLERMRKDKLLDMAEAERERERERGKAVQNNWRK